MPKSTNEYKLFKSDVTVLEKAQRILRGMNYALPKGHPLESITFTLDIGLLKVLEAGPIIDLSKPKTQTSAT